MVDMADIMDMMMQPASAAIILYGSSHLLNNVERRLRQNGRFAILRLKQAPSHFASNGELTPLKNIPAGTIIYDRNQIGETAVSKLSTSYPDWKLVGLTPHQNILNFIQ